MKGMLYISRDSGIIAYVKNTHMKIQIKLFSQLYQIMVLLLFFLKGILELFWNQDRHKVLVI